jgi:hypothetical protein
MPTNNFITQGSTTTQKSKSFRAVAPRDMSGYTATGEVYSETWEGPYEAMLSKAQAEIASPNFPTGKGGQVSVSVASTGNANQATYSVTRTVFELNSTLFADSTSAESVGKTPENPSFSTEVQEVEASILTCPVITSKNYDTDTLAALQHIAKGGSEFDVIYVSSGVAGEVVHYLPNDPDIIKLVRAQESFLDARVVHSVSWEVAAVPDLMTGVMTVQQPIGAPTVSGRDWLYVGGSLSNDGTVTRATKRYWLSGPGGWSKLYGGQGA